MEVILLIAVVLAPLAWTTMTRQWRLTFFAVMILMVFEGAVRKWVLPSFQAQIYFLKDGLVLVALVGFLALEARRGTHKRLMRGLTIFLAISLTFCFFQIGNPHSPSPFLGLIGFKSYMLYAALLMMVPYAFTSREDLEGKLRTYMLLMLPVAVLGLVQYAAPPDSFINTYVQHDVHDVDAAQRVATFGYKVDGVRATGTFSYIGGFAIFATAMFGLSLAFVLAGGRDLRRNLIPYALLVGSIAALFATGSRGAVFGAFGTLPLVLLLCMRAGLVRGARFVQLSFAAILVAFGVMYVGGGAIDSFVYRAENSDSAMMRILAPLTDLAAAFETTPAFGYGIGVTHNSAAQIMGASNWTNAWWTQGHVFEGEMARVMQELGIFGFLLFYGLRVVLFGWAVIMVQRLRTPLFKALSACIAGFYAQLFVTTVINNPTANLYWWFAAGLLFAMYRLDYPLPAVGNAAAYRMRVPKVARA